jgi:putative hydrolase of the HAD superfamily
MADASLSHARDSDTHTRTRRDSRALDRQRRRVVSRWHSYDARMVEARGDDGRSEVGAGGLRAVLFDFGGVILSSPFDAFAAYERRIGVPVGTIRTVNATAPDTNAWARLERSELTLAEFVAAFEAEAASLGHTLDGAEVLACLRGEVRPRMVEAIRRCRERYATALLTNNFVTGTPDWSSGGSFHDLLGLFDVVVESSRVGYRKPEPRFYELALEELGVGAHEAVFLDDLGVNLKPARSMGMRTIKVVDPDAALDELASITGLDL